MNLGCGHLRTIETNTNSGCHRENSRTWFVPPPHISPTAVVVLTHGLNNPPLVMNPLANALTSNGVAVVRVALAGHAPEENLDQLGTKTQWICDIDDALSAAKKRFPTVPLFGVGFSLGGAALVESLTQSSASSVAGLILFAPALTYTWRGTVLRLLSPLGSLGISLPSRGIPGYKLHPRTSLHAYSELFSISDSVRKRSTTPKLRKIPALIFISKDDELISASSLKRWIRRKNLPWLIRYLHPVPSLPESYHHLIIDPDSLGDEEWNMVLQQMTAFMSEHGAYPGDRRASQVPRT